MLQAFYNNKWCSFYPLSSVVYGEEFDDRKLEELPNTIYGKLVSGVCGYEPVWVYLKVEKNNVREYKKIKNKI